MKNGMMKKYFYFLLLLVIACERRPEISFDQTFFGGIFHQNVSVIDSIQAGKSVTLDGVYDFRLIYGTQKPVLLTYQHPGKLGYAILADSLDAQQGDYVRLAGETAKDTIIIKPGMPFVFKQLVSAEYQVLESLGEFKEMAQTVYEKRQKEIEEYYYQNNIDLNLPGRYFWRLILDKDNEKVVVYTFVERIAQIIEIDFVYKMNGKLEKIYVMEAFKGE